MGQQQSAEKEKSAGSKHQEAAKKVGRRQSMQALAVSHGRASPADPSASTTNAVAHGTSLHLGRAPLQQHLQATSPDNAAKSKVSRSTSRTSREKRTEPEQKPKEEPTPPPMLVPQPSDPMNVPVAKSKQDDFDETAFDKTVVKQELEDIPEPYHERRYTPVAQLRPPRLPLPIADAVTIPESPTLGPVDKGNADVPIFETDDPISVTQPHLRRKSSMMSQATQDDDSDVGEELPPLDPTSQTVPTTIEWNQSGYKVYVTGTFANWERKYRLHHRKDGSGLSATINLPPGTHHLMFLVDDKMTTSKDLPTCVDFNNVLVNYIELATEDVVKSRRESNQVTAPKETPQMGQEQPVPEEQHGQQDIDEGQLDEDMEPQAEEIALGDFRQIIPQALIDIDLPEDDPRYHQATRVISDGQGPPSLPMFLSRSILNGILPVKDDSSVLALPNHTVLNHLMTSSVKNGVLATSVTTRYKKKYVTTISFKPVPNSHG